MNIKTEAGDIRVAIVGVGNCANSLVQGVTYYKDSSNQVYKMDDDGDLDDTPIGVWNEQKQKIMRYSSA